VRRTSGASGTEPVSGYEIHHGVVAPNGGEPFLDGCQVGPVWGTPWHGVLENDGFRRAFLATVARRAGRAFTVAPDTCFAAVRQSRLDRLGDLVAGHLDTAILWRLVEHGPPDAER
ncbi:MAG TPA: hypothetical protein VGR21_12900, partial [Cryptosporangiaceae bacterium]|nr:hypothetical protein [Cryptosporangiaceae bacterium]